MSLDVEHVLGKITGDHPTPGGPDALLEISVERRWLHEGRTIEIDLPRHLICATCEGAGCDVCCQSGAITVRERTEPPEVLRVVLPRHDFEAGAVPESQRSLLLRIQGRGGLPESGVWPSLRGRLLLRVRVSGAVSESVREVTNDQVVSPAEPGVESDSFERSDVQLTGAHRSLAGVRLWGRIKWTGIVAGLLILLLGAAVAWFLV